MDPDGAPTPVAWTRIIAPQSLMAPTPEDVLRPGIAASALMAKYGVALDRDSAREILTRKLEAGAAAAAAEQQAKDAEKARIEAEKNAARSAPAAPRSTSRARTQKTMVQEVVSSSTFKQFARSAGREIVRSLFGTARKR